MNNRFIAEVMLCSYRMTSSGTIANAFSFCESIVNYDRNILIASLLQQGDSIGWFVRQGTPIPNEDATALKVSQARLVTSIIKQNESYLGKVNYIHVSQEMADVILFPRNFGIVLCLVLSRPYNLEDVVTKVSHSLDLLCMYGS